MSNQFCHAVGMTKKSYYFGPLAGECLFHKFVFDCPKFPDS